MASVSLARMWVNLASDLSQHLQLSHANWTGQTSVTGEVRQYASGRTRVVLQSGRPGQQKFSALTDDLTVVEQLKAWLGQTVLLRDHRGRSAWAAFLAVDEEDVAAAWTRVSVTFQTVSFDPAV